jgi:hypothetical protein
LPPGAKSKNSNVNLRPEKADMKKLAINNSNPDEMHLRNLTKLEHTFINNLREEISLIGPTEQKFFMPGSGLDRGRIKMPADPFSDIGKEYIKSQINQIKLNRQQIIDVLSSVRNKMGEYNSSDTADDSPPINVQINSGFGKQVVKRPLNFPNSVRAEFDAAIGMHQRAMDDFNAQVSAFMHYLNTGDAGEVYIIDQQKFKGESDVVKSVEKSNANRKAYNEKIIASKQAYISGDIKKGAQLQQEAIHALQNEVSRINAEPDTVNNADNNPVSNPAKSGDLARLQQKIARGNQRIQKYQTELQSRNSFNTDLTEINNLMTEFNNHVSPAKASQK